MAQNQLDESITPGLFKDRDIRRSLGNATGWVGLFQTLFSMVALGFASRFLHVKNVHEVPAQAIAFSALLILSFFLQFSLLIFNLQYMDFSFSTDVPAQKRAAVFDMVMLFYWITLVTFGNVSNIMIYFNPPFACRGEQKSCHEKGSFANVYCAINLTLQLFHLSLLKGLVTWHFVAVVWSGLCGFLSQTSERLFKKPFQSWKQWERRHMEVDPNDPGILISVDGEKEGQGGQRVPSTSGKYDVSKV